MIDLIRDHTDYTACMPNKTKFKTYKKLESKKRSSSKSQSEDPKVENLQKKKAATNDRTYESVRKKQLSEANEEEEKHIKRLEHMLKLKKKKKNKLSIFKDDGLDYVLDVIEKKNETPLLSDAFSEDKEDPYVLKGERSKSFNDTKDFVKPRTLSELLEEKEGKQLKNSAYLSDDDENMVCEEENYNSEEEELSLTVNSNKTTNKPDVWEDIYGRLRDKDGNVINSQDKHKYIPPKLIAQTDSAVSSKSEDCIKIIRNLKGLLNRLSQSNIQNICHQVEELFLKHSRNNMNETLFSLMEDLLFTPMITPTRLIMEQAMLIALLHANVGSEVGAYFLQRIVDKLGVCLEDSDTYGQGKECSNLLTFLSHLYNFKVTHCILIFDIFQILVESFQSRDIELIQLLLKNIGFVIRKDNPLKLKELILAIQEKAAEYNTDQNDFRVKFMLETLTAIKNNNMYKIPDYDPSIMEHAKKLLKGMIRKGSYIQELAISYDDLLKANERGRWWIVGSAWSNEDNSKREKEVTNLPKTEVSEKILALAKKQHMNTDVRKSIFCILMTAEDYMDAFEKLLKLNLKNQQEREIIHVLLYCVLKEKSYNPYYSFLAEKFCSFSRNHRMCLQYSLWDKFKELSNFKKSELNNLSQFLSHLFISGALPLSVLKVIHFSDMNKMMVKFFRQILLAVLLADSEEACANVFARISNAENLRLLRESLRLFLLHFVLRNQSELEPETSHKLQTRVKIAENLLKPPKRIF